jgi:predicted DNA-binding helix-hairpin-helix protein
MDNKFRHLIKKVGIKAMRMMDPEKMPDGQDNAFVTETFSICKRLISKEDSILLISPISGKRYINSADKQLYIIIEPRMATIVNHSYSYNIQLTSNSYSKIVRIFDAEVESRREIMETEIKSNVKHSLSEIYKNLVNE